MKYTYLALLFVAFKACLVLADSETIFCNSTSQCPEEQPCCSQYGQCGTGFYCLGGCDPRYSFNLSACMPMPVMKEFNTSFTNISEIANINDYLGNASETDWIYSGHIAGHNKDLMLQMPNGTTGSVISSSSYLWYGKVSARLKTSRTNGVVTAFILFSDVQDEIDFECVGYNLTFPQSNYYSRGFLDYHNANSSETSDTFENYHLYELDWDQDRIEWSIDGSVVRTLTKESTWNDTAKVFNYPQTPTRIQMSLWPGGALSNGLGTIEWAGGAIDWNAADIQQYGYFYAYLDYVSYKAHDWPEGVKRVGSNNTKDLNAFVYNSSNGNQSNIMWVKAKTWIGSSDASGLNPDNEDEEVTTVISSGSSKSTKTNTIPRKTSSGTNTNVPTMVTNGAPKATGGSNGSGNSGDSNTVAYNSEDGFVQNYKATSTGTNGGSSGSSSNEGSSLNLDWVIGMVSAMGVGVFSFLV
ncbi:extracellular glycosidase Utr2p [[Candida] anglica]|uniref:Extracellular glycosidase Utr2p n=1 Tax=[Candida] anglica TaxID=148631 RepID=A0ABP0ECX9_9ASCO